MIFGMPTLVELPELEENMRLCKELNLDFVELNMNLPQYQIEQLEHSYHLREIADRYQLFYTIHLDENLNVSDFNHAVAQAYRETVKRAIEAAKILSIPILNMHMNHGVHFTLPYKKVQLFDEYKEEYMDSMLQFRTMCEKTVGNQSIKICIENTDGFLNYEKDAIELLLQSNVFKLTWDIGHSNSSEEVDKKFIIKNKERLGHFHIHDGLGKKDHMTLGTGEIDLHKRLELARECHSRCVVETKTVKSLCQSVEWLREEGYKN